MLQLSFSDLLTIKKDTSFFSLFKTAEASIYLTSSAISEEYLGQSTLSCKESPLPYNDAKYNG